MKIYKRLKEGAGIVLAVCLSLLSCSKPDISEQPEETSKGKIENSLQSSRSSDCADFEIQDQEAGTVTFIKIKGTLHRPKVLECHGVRRECYCGFGVCDVSVKVFGHQIIGDRIMPDNDGIDTIPSINDEAIMVSSVDGKYALIKFTQLEGSDRQLDNETFTIDECIELTAIYGSKEFCQAIYPQEAITIYPHSYSSLQTVINNLSRNDVGAINPCYFYFDADHLGLQKTVAIAIIKLHN